MSKLDYIKETLIGEPVPYDSASEHTCEICAVINDEVTP